MRCLYCIAGLLYRMDYSITYYMLLVVTGLVAGVINTLAGGGSNLTLPALMISGMPADVANATNRVGVFMQCLVGIKGFKKHDKLDTQDMVPVLVPTVIGSVFGSLAAALLPTLWLKPLLLSTMIGMSLLILIKPSVIAPPDGTPVYKVKERPLAWVGLFICGVYGGFVQAGVGFIMITVLAGTLRYDLVRTNALKLLCIAALTSIALVVFIIDDLIQWLPGLALALGSMVGAAIAVRIALNISQKAMKWFLFLMTLCASAAALFIA